MTRGAETEVSPLSFERQELEQTFSDRWARVVERYASRPALQDDKVKYTYAALDDLSRRFALAIRQACPQGPGAVALLAPQNASMVTGALSILRSGHALVGLHPRQPDDALTLILDDCRPLLLVCTKELESRARALAAAASCPVLVLTASSASSDSTRLKCTVRSEDPCLILYTSGTTGRPKGVVKSHRMLLHRVWLGQQHDQIEPTDRASVLTHVAFASAEADLFATLLLGACVCVFDSARQGLPALRRWLQQERISLFHPPVVLFRRFLKTLRAEERFPLVRLVALAGDVVVPEDLQLWSRHFSESCELRYRFSTTETALLSVAHIKLGEELSHCGRPVEDKKVEVWQENTPVGVGETGEIVVRSRYLASGYWGKAPESELAFKPCEASDEVLYRTGDLGFFDSKGNLHFVGREDDQVKIRGFRLSCREVKAAILKIDEVMEAAVVPDRKSGETELQAWITLRDGQQLTEARLREKLSHFLPEWKIPSVITLEQRLPKTLTGKVDMVSLREQGNGKAGLDHKLQELWRSLGRQAVTPDDDLLLHGGDSITIVLLLHEIEQHFEVEITPQEFFTKRTLGYLVELIQKRSPQTVELETQEPRKESPPDLVANCSDAFLLRLQEMGLQYFFINPGTDSAPLLESLVKFRSLGQVTPEPVLCLHEFVAMCCAHGYFMVRREPQMVFVHVDLGTQNLGGSLHNAQRGRAGVVIVAGCAPYTLEGRDASRDRYAHWVQQQRDQTSIVRNYVKWDYTLAVPENLNPATERAFRLAGSSPAGPVYLTLPREVFMAPAVVFPQAERFTETFRKSPDSQALEKTARWLLEADSPLLLTSRAGTDPTTVQPLVELCELLALPVVESRHRMNFPHSHPLHLGFSPNQYLFRADLVLSLDHEVPWIPNQWTPAESCRIIQVDPDTEKLDVPLWGLPVDLSIEAESLLFVRALLSRVKELMTPALEQSVSERRETHAETHRRLRRRWEEVALQRRHETPLAPPWFGYCLNKVLDDDALIVCDAATNNPVLWTYLKKNCAGTFFQSLGSCLGWGLGAAVGAKLASPEKLVVAVVGDGCWMFANPLAAYEVSRNQDAPFLTVVLNNEKYAAISEAVQSLAPAGHARRNQSYPACRLPDSGYYARIAGAAGLWSGLVRDPDKLLATLEQALIEVRKGRSALVEVWVSSPNP